jgi:transcriptional regulator of acetoin/glycerol metabolism
MVASVDLGEPYQQMLVKEWERCNALGIDAHMSRGKLVGEAEFEQALLESHELLEKANPIIERVSNCLLDVPGVLILADHRGIIVDVVGDDKVKQKAAESSGIMKRTQWLEEVAGTNGLGSAIHKRAPVHVYASEHFCEGWHEWTCAATPIVGPQDDLVGVIDFTTLQSDYRDQAVGLTYSLANSIQAALRLDYELERSRLNLEFIELAGRYPADDLVLVDRAGRVVRATRENLARRVAGGAPLPGATPIPLFMPCSAKPIGTAYLVPRVAVVASVQSGDDAVLRMGGFLTRDGETKKFLRFVSKVAPSDVNVLVVGETGTGKELIARYVHEQSSRASGPYVAVNCGALSKELFASCFFGYVGGAFTGADPKGRKGFFEAADGGTLFLDEIGELPLEIQAALLRVLEDGTFQRVGAEAQKRTNCRVIAATNRDLACEIESGSFRKDLYFRLNVIRHLIPPLRERRDDIELLATHFLAEMSEKHSLERPELTAEAWTTLKAFDWPGNVRQLRNAIEAIVLCADGSVDRRDLPPDILEQPGAAAGGAHAEPAGADDGMALKDYERRVIVSALRKYRKVNRVARELGVSRSTLYRKFEQLGIDHQRFL